MRLLEQKDKSKAGLEKKQALINGEFYLLKYLSKNKHKKYSI